MNKHTRKRHSSIQFLLSTYFVVFAFALLALTVALVSWVQYRAARADGIETLHRTSVSVADSVEQQINQMDQISQNAISLADMQTVFEAYTSGSAPSYERSQQRSQLVNLLTTARGLDFSIRQLNVYTPPEREGSTNGYGVGEYYGDLPVSVDTLSWYEAAREAKGRYVMAVSGAVGKEDALEDRLENADIADDSIYLSVCRMFYNVFHVPVGFTEVKKYYSEVFSLASSPELTYQASIHVYDKNGVRLFPLGSDGENFDYFPYASEHDQSILNTVSGQKEMVSFAVSGPHGLVIAASTPQSVFRSQVYRSMAWIFIAFLALFALALLVSLMLSRQISLPIRRIYHFLSDEKKDQFAALTMEETGIREIDKLTASINESIRSTQVSTQTMMTLKEQEVQAQMLAMQAQMNPHFLYNSLSTVGEMAEEGLTAPVAEMCREITEIMRYISSNREQRSPLQEELEICDMYLDCIRMRYGDQLISRIEVPDDMLDVMIPKLCIQLLVENAVRSVTTATPPWHVTVSCEIRGEHWYVTVRDNGPGFDPEVDKNLRRQMDHILETGTLPSLKIQGMGILNIFIRLYLLDGIPFIFDLGNNPEGGAYVTIGGSMKRDSKDEENLQ